MTVPFSKGFSWLEEWPQVPKKNSIKETSSQSSIKDIGIFFSKNLSSAIWQWPIKKIPKRNKIEKIEEPLTPEMKAEIIKLFWEHYDDVIF